MKGRNRNENTLKIMDEIIKRLLQVRRNLPRNTKYAICHSRPAATSSMNAPTHVEEARAKNAEQYFDHLMYKGSETPLKFEKLSPPSWYDDEKFRRGQQFIRDNYFFVSTSVMCGVFIAVLDVAIQRPFFETGKFGTTINAIHRYYNASLMVRSWFNGDIYEKKSKSYKTLYRVGITHVKYSSTLVDGHIGITQKDLAIGIFAFMIIAMSEYDHFYTQSANEFDKKKFEGYLHLWRVIAYHNGQMDEFNVFDGNPFDVRKKCEKMFQMIFKPILNEPLQNDGKLFKRTLAFMKCWCFLIDKDGLIEFARRKQHLPEKTLTTKNSRIFVSLMLFLHEKVLKTWWISPIARPILNRITKMAEYTTPVAIKLLDLIQYEV